MYQEYEPTPDNPCEIKGLNLLESGEIIRKIVPIKYVNDYVRVCHENKQLKDRINKAIEYMEQWGKEPDADMYMQMKDYNEFKYLLKILKEDNKEEI